MTNDVVAYENSQVATHKDNPDQFQKLWDMAVCLSQSNIIPDNFRNNPANCVVALDMAQRLGTSIMPVMQNLYIIHGKPSWSSQFIIAAINSCGRFKSLRFEFRGETRKDAGCRAWAISRDDGEKLFGPWVTMEMAEKEGWTSKKGSKWLNMAELMLRYRAATFFGRLYAPDIMMGMQTMDEVHDIHQEEARSTTVDDLFDDDDSPSSIDCSTGVQGDEIIEGESV